MDVLAVALVLCGLVNNMVKGAQLPELAPSSDKSKPFQLQNKGSNKFLEVEIEGNGTLGNENGPLMRPMTTPLKSAFRVVRVSSCEDCFVLVHAIQRKEGYKAYHQKFFYAVSTANSAGKIVLTRWMQNGGAQENTQVFQWISRTQQIRSLAHPSRYLTEVDSRLELLEADGVNANQTWRFHKIRKCIYESDVAFDYCPLDPACEALLPQTWMTVFPRVPSAEACCNICKAYTGCTAWKFLADGGCYMHEGVHRVQLLMENSGFTSGVVADD